MKEGTEYTSNFEVFNIYDLDFKIISGIQNLCCHLHIKGNHCVIYKHFPLKNVRAVHIRSNLRYTHDHSVCSFSSKGADITLKQEHQE